MVSWVVFVVITAVEGAPGSASFTSTFWDAAKREDLLHRLNELVHEGVELLGRGTRPPQPKVERVVEVCLVVSARVEKHRQQAIWRHAGAGRVELQFADGDAHAVGP
jgi:hypothetical protein